MFDSSSIYRVFFAGSARTRQSRRPHVVKADHACGTLHVCRSQALPREWRRNHGVGSDDDVAQRRNDVKFQRRPTLENLVRTLRPICVQYVPQPLLN